jgi:citrate lyase subunit beta/citryl-CoA lyase
LNWRGADGRLRRDLEQVMTARPRRSCLYMPGANAKALEKAKTLAADVLLLDLEDSVAPEAKADARAQVAAAVQAGGYGKREVIVRVNALATPWGRDDIVAAGAAGPDGMLAPKVESAAQVKALDEAMTAAGFGADTSLWVMIETPRAILNLAEIAAAAKDTRLSVFVMGLNDLAKETRARTVIAAFALPENAGKGVIRVDGRMTELLHLEEAKRVVAVAEAITDAEK